METLEELEQVMLDPSERLVRDVARLDGDLIILGVGGKMGPSLAKLAKRAFERAGLNHRVIGVSRFWSGEVREDLERSGVETISADLLEEEQLQALPDAKYVIHMVGRKFGTTGKEHLTWAMNAYLPGRVALKYRNSRIVSFSTGNVYPLVKLAQGGATEEDPPRPAGEYAQSCLAGSGYSISFPGNTESRWFIFASITPSTCVTGSSWKSPVRCGKNSPSISGWVRLT